MNKPLHHILIRPILTEKSVRSTQLKRFSKDDAKERSRGNQNAQKALLEERVVKYTFVVAINATKTEIAQAVETLYAKEKVKVANVNTMHVRGKERKVTAKRGRRPSVGMTPNWKKAIVTLETGSPTVPELEGV